MPRLCITAKLACPVERVWETVTDLSRQDWRSDVARVETAGEMAFVEYTGDGFATTFTVTRLEPPHYWAFDLENKNIKGRWTGEFLPTAGGCTVTFTEDVTPKRAWMRPFAAVYLKKQQRQYLADLREALDL
nr:SRPBCC family protein [uncultured Oscillibacter sp.]